MSLDHIVSLAVAIAEAPGSYSFLLGSGVSRDAGVLTGAEVFTRAVEELYRLENKSEATPPPDELNDWLSEAVRPDMRYSDVLELIAPDPATRLLRRPGQHRTRVGRGVRVAAARAEGP